MGKARRRPFRYNNYGFTVGGPVYFFNFGERSSGDSMFGKVPKTYFFFSEEQRRDIRFPTLTSTVPTSAIRQEFFRLIFVSMERFREQPEPAPTFCRQGRRLRLARQSTRLLSNTLILFTQVCQNLLTRQIIS
jgi:hypothetical protein